MPPKSKQSPSKQKAQSQKNADPCIVKRFPVKQIRELLVQKFPNGTVSDEATAFMASVLEYVSTEIIELGANAAKTRTGNDKEIKMTIDDVMRGVNTDKEMKELVESTKKSEK